MKVDERVQDIKEKEKKINGMKVKRRIKNPMSSWDKDGRNKGHQDQGDKRVLKLCSHIE